MENAFIKWLGLLAVSESLSLLAAFGHGYFSQEAVSLWMSVASWLLGLAPVVIPLALILAMDCESKTPPNTCPIPFLRL